MSARVPAWRTSAFGCSFRIPCTTIVRIELECASNTDGSICSQMYPSASSVDCFTGSEPFWNSATRSGMSSGQPSSGSSIIAIAASTCGAVCRACGAGEASDVRTSCLICPLSSAVCCCHRCVSAACAMYDFACTQFLSTSPASCRVVGSGAASFASSVAIVCISAGRLFAFAASICASAACRVAASPDCAASRICETSIVAGPAARGCEVSGGEGGRGGGSGGQRSSGRSRAADSRTPRRGARDGN